MPYVIKRPVKKGISAAVALVAVGAALLAVAGPAMAGQLPPGMAALDTSACTDPTLSQPFTSFKDSNYYMLMPGESVDNFDGGGWTLNDGAQIVQTTLADGTTGDVLDLPPGSSAISPVICVTSAYPTARTMVLGDMGVQFAVSYEGTDTWTHPKNTGQLHGNKNGWKLSDNLNLQPQNSDSWQLMRVQLTPPNKGANDTQVYNFYVDPYAKRT